METHSWTASWKYRSKGKKMIWGLDFLTEMMARQWEGSRQEVMGAQIRL